MFFESTSKLRVRTGWNMRGKDSMVLTTSFSCIHKQETPDIPQDFEKLSPAKRYVEFCTTPHRGSFSSIAQLNIQQACYNHSQSRRTHPGKNLEPEATCKANRFLVDPDSRQNI
jgi:hypothetical protein